MSSTVAPGAAVPQLRDGPPCCTTISLCSTEARRSEKTGAAMVRALSQSSVRNGSAGRPSPPERFVRDALVNAYRTATGRSEEHTSELQSLMRISYAVFCLKKKKNK